MQTTGRAYAKRTRETTKTLDFTEFFGNLRRLSRAGNTNNMSNAEERAG
jgi:hypothetical protein